MIKLATWQQQLLQDIVTGSTSKTLEPALQTAAQLEAKEAIAIYRNNCFGTKINALKITYRSLYLFLGEDYFEQLATGFVRKNPSQHSNLDYYGDDFPSYIKQQQRTRPELGDYPYLAELAELNQLQQRLQNMPPPQQTKTYGNDYQLLSTPEALSFTLNTNIQYLKSTYNLAYYWHIAHDIAINHHDQEQEQEAYTYLIAVTKNNVEFLEITPCLYDFLVTYTSFTLTDLLSANDSLTDSLPVLIQQAYLAWRPNHV